MKHGEIKSNDPVLLKQTIIYLRSELNKYKSTNDPTSSSLLDELISENERLTNKYKDLLHQNKKYAKRIQLYEKRIRSLESQRKSSISNLERLQCTEQELREANSQLSDILLSIGSERQLETEKIIESIEMKMDSYLHHQDTLPESDLATLQLDLETAQNVNAKQSELIGILEEYIQQLMEEVHAYKELTEYFIQKTSDIAPDQDK